MRYGSRLDVEVPGVHHTENRRAPFEVAEQPGQLARPDVHDVRAQPPQLLAQGIAQATREPRGAQRTA